MTPAWSRTRAPLAAVLCLVALAAVSLALTPHPPPDPFLGVVDELLQWTMTAPLRSLFLILITGGLVLLGTMVGMSLYAYRKGRRVDGWALLLRRLANTILGYAFISLFALGVRSCRSEKPKVPPPTPPQAQQAPEGTGTQARRAAPPTAEQNPPVIAYLVLVAVLLVGGGLLLVVRKKPAITVEPLEPGEPELLARVRKRLELGDHVRDAIIACYAEMCDVFLRGTPASARNLTAREFSAFLRARGVLEPEIQALTTVFEKARYSLEPCGERDRERALQALHALEARYGAPREGTP